MRTIFNCALLASFSFAQMKESYTDMIDKSHFKGGMGTVANKAEFIMISPELVEAGKGTVEVGEPCTLRVEFYYKNNADTNVREFHGNLYLDTPTQIEDGSTVAFSFNFQKD